MSGTSYTYTTAGKYIDPTIDAGFKILFGREESKEILISLLNAILSDDLKERITSISFLDKEKIMESDEERSVVFDLHCTTDTGKRLIVEMQNLEQQWFVERCLFYGCRAVTEQGRSGKWDYEYDPVISIAFTNFTNRRFDGQRVADGAIIDRHSGKPITDRMRLIFIQLPEFRQDTPEECLTELEQWVYTIKNMKDMESIPFYTTNPIFRRVDQLARKENLSQSERREYERGLKYYRDIQNQYNYGMQISLAKGLEQGLAEGLEQGRTQGLEQGRAQGLEQGRAQGLEQGIAQGRAQAVTEERTSFAKRLLASGIPVEDIARFANLPVEAVKKLSGELS